MECWAQRAGSDVLAPLLKATVTVPLQPWSFVLCFHMEGPEKWGKTRLCLSAPHWPFLTLLPPEDQVHFAASRVPRPVSSGV